ncbi:MAG: hypothetical protein KAJ55_00300 [Anaerolineales bacterium]|nr:hypothetical protein [Anaerolineales bacterium]
MIKPALTPEEWGPGPGYTGPRVDVLDRAEAWIEYADVWYHSDEGEETIENRHGVAALCLHEQEFGFTPEDVENHRHLATTLRRRATQDKLARPTMLAIADWHDSMSARIEALLPPMRTTLTDCTFSSGSSDGFQIGPRDVEIKNCVGIPLPKEEG